MDILKIQLVYKRIQCSMVISLLIKFGDFGIQNRVLTSKCRPLLRMFRLTSLLVLVVTQSLANQVVQLTSDSFDAHIKHGKWLVKFYAPWCGHCKRLSPVLDTVAAMHFKEHIHIGKVDVDQESSLKSRFDIRGYPTLLYFEDGETAAPFNGGRDVDSIVRFGERMKSPLFRNFETEANLMRWLDFDSPERSVETDPLSYLIFIPKGLDLEQDDVFTGLRNISKHSRSFILFTAVDSEQMIRRVCNGLCVASSDKPWLLRYEPGVKIRSFDGDLFNETSIKEWIKDNSVPVSISYNLERVSNWNL